MTNIKTAMDGIFAFKAAGLHVDLPRDGAHTDYAITKGRVTLTLNRRGRGRMCVKLADRLVDVSQFCAIRAIKIPVTHCEWADTAAGVLAFFEHATEKEMATLVIAQAEASVRASENALIQERGVFAETCAWVRHQGFDVKGLR